MEGVVDVESSWSGFRCRRKDGTDEMVFKLGLELS